MDELKTNGNRPLIGQTAVVTGGTRGIGRGISLALADAGADVAVISQSGKGLDEVTQELTLRGVRAAGRAFDLTQTDGIGALFEDIAGELGGIDILVNNAGVQITGPAVDVTAQDWDTTMAVNLKVPFFCAQALAKGALARGTRGKIVNITSNAAVVGFPDFSAYSAAKGGLLQLTRTLAAEWAQHGINVNAVGTALVITEMTRHLLDDEEWRTRYLASIPSRQFSQVGDVAAAVVFLCCPAANQIHGEQIMVDGGYTAV
jgi:NAD(P)-dependent dehydrogenase (short-subunit alcohol dehydrogenase family)